jgi:hypothetical protein
VIIYRGVRAFARGRLLDLATGLRAFINSVKLALETVPKALAAALKIAAKPSERADYVETRRLYVAKSFILGLIATLIAIALFGWFVGYPFIVSKLFTLRIWESDDRLPAYSGRVIVTYDEALLNPKFQTRLNRGAPIETAVVYDESAYIVYEGGYDKLTYSGAGSLYDKGTLIYKGEFQDNQKSGLGKEYFPNGVIKYAGTFEEDLYSGTGKEYANTGALVYSGEFAEGLFNGAGIYYKPDSITIEGTFSRDYILGDAVLRKSGKLAYKGAFDGMNPGGFGTLYDIDTEAPLFAGLVNANELDLRQFEGFTADAIRASFFASPLRENLKSDHFTITEPNTGLVFICTLKTPESEPQVLQVTKLDGAANSLIKEQVGELLFFKTPAANENGETGGVSGGEASSETSDKIETDKGGYTGEPPKNGIDAAEILAAALDDLLIAEPDPFYPTFEEPRPELPPLSELLSASELDAETLGKVLIAATDYVRYSAYIEALQSELSIKNSELAQAENAAKTGGGDTEALRLTAELEKLSERRDAYALSLARAGVIIRDATGADIREYRATDALFEQDFANFNLAIMAAGISDKAALVEFKLKTLDLAINKNALDSARADFAKSVADLQAVKQEFASDKTTIGSVNNAACNVLENYTRFYNALADYSKTLIELNIICGGRISDACDWLKTDFAAAFRRTKQKLEAEEALKAAEANANAALPALPDVL